MVCEDEPIGNRSIDGVPDLTLISNIDENGINENLKVRYNRQQIYTYAGSILIAVNPYEELDIYEQEWQQMYCGKRLGDIEPHVFAIAESSYRHLCSDDSDQSIVISGESGAGKTESTKFILQYLCSVTSSQSSWVEHQILEANTILEAFGNAKTARNDNSSRFGKFIQVCFDERGQIGGCVVRDYLLERSRIALQSTAERNYHVFYQLVSAAKRDQELAKKLQLDDPNLEFIYLNQSGCTSIDGVDDAANFDSLRLAMSVLRVPEEMSDGLFSALSAILWLGNLEFEEQQETERCRLTSNDELIISTVATLLGVDAYRLTLITLRRQISVRGTVTDIPLNLKEARENRHAMAMAIYSRTFSWLVKHINACTLPDQCAKRFIGVLDIFGFENFNNNSFEQLCINYANEKLQRFFNHYVFALEQQIYHDEGISFEHINFTDNTPCVELLEKPPKCILRLLSEECKIPRGTDITFVQKLHQEFGDSNQQQQQSTNQYYVKGDDRRNWNYQFGIKHYAGDVMYQVTDFLAKNKDVQQDQLFEIMLNSQNDFIKSIATLQDTTESIYGTIGRIQDGKTSKGRPLVVDAFRQQLSALVDLLSATCPWYVRCIKPNLTKSSRDYDIAQVHTQLRYLGMLDIIRIRREGFPAHYKFDIFIARFRCLLLLVIKHHHHHHSSSNHTHPHHHHHQNVPNLKPNSTSVRELLNRIRVDPLHWQIGHSKVFLKAIAADELEERRTILRQRMAIRIQSNWRCLIHRRNFKLYRSSAIIIQRAFRSMRQRLLYQRMRRAAITIQAFVRGMFAREVARALRHMRTLEALEKAKEQQRQQQQANEENDEQRRKHEAEVAASEQQINGHFLGKRTSTVDELDELERQLRDDVERLYNNKSIGNGNGAGGGRGGADNNYEEIENDDDQHNSHRYNHRHGNIVPHYSSQTTGETPPLPPPPPPPPTMMMNGKIQTTTTTTTTDPTFDTNNNNLEIGKIIEKFDDDDVPTLKESNVDDESDHDSMLSSMSLPPPPSPSLLQQNQSMDQSQQQQPVNQKQHQVNQNSISDQFDQLIQKTELAVDSLDRNLQTMITSSNNNNNNLNQSNRSRSPRHHHQSNQQQPQPSLTDKLKAILIVEDSYNNSNNQQHQQQSLVENGQISPKPSPSICSVDSAVSDSPTSSTSSSTLMVSGKDDHHNNNHQQQLHHHHRINAQMRLNHHNHHHNGSIGSSDRSSTASSSIHLDNNNLNHNNRTSISSSENVPNGNGITDDLSSIMSDGAATTTSTTTTTSDFELNSNSNSSPHQQQLPHLQQQQQLPQQFPPPPPPVSSGCMSMPMPMAPLMPQQASSIYGQRIMLNTSTIPGGPGTIPPQPIYTTNGIQMVPVLAPQPTPATTTTSASMLTPQQIQAITNSKFITKQIEAHQQQQIRQQQQQQQNNLNGELLNEWEKDFELIEYAEKYFNKHKRDDYSGSISGSQGQVIRTLTRTKQNNNNNKESNNLNNNQNNLDFLTLKEMITWTSNQTIPTSHVHLNMAQNINLSCTIFKEFIKYLSMTCNEKKSSTIDQQKEIRFIQSMIGYGIEREELRDEIFIQLIRQSNDNPNKDQMIKCWSLLALTTAAFLPSKQLSKYLLTYFRRNLRHKNTSISCYAQFCLDNLHVGRLSSRKFPPSQAEIKAVTSLRSLVCRFYLLDGRTKAMDLHPADTASDAILSLATKLGLRNIDGWALFEITPEGERVLRSHDYVADVLTLWEMRSRRSENGKNGHHHHHNHTNSSISNTLPHSTSLDSIAASTSIAANCRFVFKKRLFRNTNEIPRDTVEVSLLYAQAVNSVVRLDEFPVSERIALQLAGLQAQVLMGNFIEGRLRNYEDVENYISARVRRSTGHSSMEWAVKISDAHRLYGYGKSSLHSKVWYLSLVMQYPLYGATLFPVQYKGVLALFGNQPLLLGIHSTALLIVAASDKRILATYKYQDIESITIYPHDSLITFNLFRDTNSDMITGNIGVPTIPSTTTSTTTTTTTTISNKSLTFETNQKEEIVSLISSYSPQHSIPGSNHLNDQQLQQRLSQQPSRRLLKMTLEDRLRLHTEVINCRRALIQANIMRKPISETSGTKWRTTLRRLGGSSAGAGGTGKKSSKSNMKFSLDDDNYLNDEILKNYPRPFWAYIKEPLISSLLVISDPDLEAAAVTMFEQILSYSGLRNHQQQQQQQESNSNSNQNNGKVSPSSSIEDEWCIRQTQSEQNQIRSAQQILEKCLGGDADILRNEFFLQLIRQTTDHPIPNSKVNIRHWQLLALACSLTQPSDRRILAYLHAHLRKCALDQITREGQYAQFALRNLQGTLETRGRRLAPSRPEIAATIQCRRVYARVHFLDGHFQAVEFDACAVIAEVLEQIQLKIELRPHAPGYALYQALGQNGAEQALQPEDKVGDAIAFWERWHDEHHQQPQQSNGRLLNQEPVHYFIFKKHLQIDSYIDLTDPVERELLYHQTLHNVRNDRFPLTDQEAILLVAIRAQLEFDDSTKFVQQLQQQQHHGFNHHHPMSNLDEIAYSQLIAKTLPERLACRILVKDVKTQHQIQNGMDQNQAKQAFFNLIKSWPLHRATVFEVLQTYTSSWPKTLWLAIDQSGMHLLQPRTRNVLCSCEYRNLVDYTATTNSLMIVANMANSTMSKAVKYMFITHQALQIAQLLRDYTSAVTQQQQTQSKLANNINNGGGSILNRTGSITNKNNNNNNLNGNLNGGNNQHQQQSINGSTTSHNSSNYSTIGSTGRRKSVEFDLALRNMSTADKNHHKSVAFSGMLAAAAAAAGGGGGGGGSSMMIPPVPQPRRSLMSSTPTYDTQFYMQQQQLYQNHQQLQYQMFQHQQQQQQHNQQPQQQRRPRPLARHGSDTDHV